MKFPEFTDDLSIVSKLGDNPGADNGLTAEGLKAKFDEGSLALQKFINSVLIAKLNEIFVAGGQLNDGLIMTGPINMNLNMLFGLADPKNDSEAVSYGFAKNNYVPKSRKVNGKSLSADITLSALDVNARPNTWIPSASDVGARPNTWLPTIAEIGAAPTGYGLGGGATGKAVKSIEANGWYITNEDTPNSTWLLCHARVTNNGSDITVDAWNLSGTTRYKITKRSGTWGEWEFDIPLMSVGFEYRTTEKYKGKTVWTVLADLNTCPAGETIVNTSFTATEVVRWDGNDCVFESARNDKYLRTKRVSIVSGKLAITNIFGTQVGSSHEYCRIWYTKD